VDIEKKWQKKWENAGIFQANPDSDKKLFLTVAYPYPSGAMHIGHGRTYTVPDVYARFKRMQGYNVLFPMAWHVTGAPVIGIAKRIQRKDPWTWRIYQKVHKVPPGELEKFSNPEYIVEYFSKEYKRIMKAMGYSIDWRREFKTTDPQYQKFIEWQIKKLKKKGLVRKGEHPVKYCPECENPVGDHDLLEGEGVAINQLTILKFKIEDSYLVAATFRPETVYGVTNIWINPREEYIKVEVDDEKWIISKKSYKNLSEQKKGMEIIELVNPENLVGSSAKNPMTGSQHPILPAYFVDPEYGTGVVFSVPAHAPADYIALQDLKNNKKLQEKYNLKDLIKEIKPVNVITIKGYGECPACETIEKFKIKNQKDPKLDDATNELYKIEHAKGKMSQHIPGYNGMPVAEAREKIAKQLKSEGKADEIFDFSEHPVICRCGSRCIVKIMENQWFIKYSDPKWKKITRKCLNSLKIIPEEVKANFEYYIEWLDDWACARRIGLGTPLPWDPEWIIEPLSDSTIYMSYYTIVPHLKKLPAKTLDDEFFDTIFLNKNNKQTKETHKISEEFNYWYPLDWRLSAKDLIGNHLTFHLFHHSAIFPPSKWPKGIVVFGMGLLEGKKMSSSKGNVVLLSDAIKTHGADVVRLFLMSSAEPWQDFDWREKEVIGTKRRLEWFKEFGEKISKIIGSKKLLDSKIPEPSSFIAKWMMARINLRIKETTKALEKFQTRRAVQEAFFLLRKDVDHYMKRVKYNVDEEARALLKYLIGVWIRLMAPFIPHTAEEMWEKYGGEGFVSEAPWPRFHEEFISVEVQRAEEMVQGTVKDILEIKKILSLNPEKVHVYVAPEWKWRILELAAEIGKPDMGALMGRAVSEGIHEDKREIADFIKRILKDVVRGEYTGRIDEYKILSDAKSYMEDEVDAKVIIHKDAEYDPEGKAKNAIPYKPAIYLE